MIYNTNDYRRTAKLMPDILKANIFAPHWEKDALDRAGKQLSEAADRVDAADISESCFACGKPVSPRFKYCPWCRKRLKEDTE